MPAPDHNAHLLHSKPLTAPALLAMRDAGQKIAALTCYDASFATLMNACGVELLLVGDSLGNVVQGQGTTLPVSVADIAYHTASVARGNRTAVLAADMPFGSYATPQAAYANAVQLIQAGAHMVKLEGGSWLCGTVRFLTERGIPVFAHLGLTPQSVHQLGGFKVQGKTAEGAAALKADALALQAAGAALLLLEAIPATLGREVSALLAIPTIGIGAGPDCSGQILVMHDMLNVFPGKKVRFVRDFMTGQASIGGAFTAYVGAVKERSFPAPQHCF
ncbi:3-methyl-2-oxobutanoate hydroxymethyltransferase [Janthinobacterium lividum]|uniref:3-methyl-2-oxobutanoate hydroxymethyltransferase n=1 Tax=Janthinobacterium lividum TaxID=29581 RepID=UPI000538908F|nr:3-methyl-2-oxobutanoate hydroxymethyltransferase [Janthinobacterium lividum]KHA75776.1 3-methyl-2-oxobutanoate hydroxymethyltransferase [Janthinobacterium lividum]